MVHGSKAQGVRKFFTPYPWPPTPPRVKVYLNMEKKIMVLRKNACPDCSLCQCCSPTRCSICLPKGGEKQKDKKPKAKIHKPLFRPY